MTDRTNLIAVSVMRKTNILFRFCTIKSNGYYYLFFFANHTKIYAYLLMNMLYTMSVNQFLRKRYSFSQVLPCFKVIFKNITKENQNITLAYIKKRISKIKKNL